MRGYLCYIFFYWNKKYMILGKFIYIYILFISNYCILDVWFLWFIRMFEENDILIFLGEKRKFI